MPTSHTQVTLYNLALDAIGEFPISTLADNSPYARWLNRNFPSAVEAALRQQPWNFATDLVVLNTSPTPPPYRWRYAYDLPPKWLRVLPPVANGVYGGRPLPYEVKRNRLLMNDAPPRPVEIVFSVQDPGEWDALFATMIAARLAHGLAMRFTAKSSYIEVTRVSAQEAYEAAQEANSFEGSMQPFDDLDIIRVRGG